MTDFTPVHEWAKANEATGTMFCKGDVESTYEAWSEDNPTWPPFEDVWPTLRDSWYWTKGIQESLAEHGFLIIGDMISDAMSEVG